MLRLTIFLLILTIVYYINIAHTAGTDQTLFKRISFSDSIWSNHYSKEEFQLLAAGENGVVECGTMCSIREDDCVLFKYDPGDGTCILSKVRYFSRRIAIDRGTFIGG